MCFFSGIFEKRNVYVKSQRNILMIFLDIKMSLISLIFIPFLSNTTFCLLGTSSVKQTWQARSKQESKFFFTTMSGSFYDN